jgi:outer membrane protein assembly factor BamD
MDRADDAKARLEALHQTIPRPTKAAVAQNKAEEDSRRSPTFFSKVLRPIEKHPDTFEAAKIGEPTLVDPTPVSASQVVQEATRAVTPASTGSGTQSVSVETVGTGAPAPDQPAPRSDATPAADDAPAAAAPPDSSSPAAEPPTANELKPNVPADPNELKPNVSDDSEQALPPPQQVNQIQSGTDGQTAATPPANGTSANSTASASDQPATDEDMASSKPKKKKTGIHKIVPF